MPVRLPVKTGLPPDVQKTIQELAAQSGSADDPRLTKLLAVITQTSFWYSRQGPLPSPHEFAEYDRILPGCAERILTSAERQLHHRIAIESTVITAQTGQSGRGQILGFIVALVCLFLSFIAIMQGHEIAGTIIGSIDLVSLVAVFVLGTQSQRRSLQEKARAVPLPEKRN